MFIRVVKRCCYYVLLSLSFFSRLLRVRRITMSLLMLAHKSQGVVFEGIPRYIHTNAYLDGLGGLFIEDDVVISTNVIILTHDYSYNVGLKACNMVQKGDTALLDSVRVGAGSFIGAGSIILPGSKIGKYCVVGAGSVVKGDVKDYSIVVGNPGKVIKNTIQWGESLYSNTKLTGKFIVDK